MRLMFMSGRKMIVWRDSLEDIRSEMDDCVMTLMQSVYSLPSHAAKQILPYSGSLELDREEKATNLMVSFLLVSICGSKCCDDGQSRTPGL